MNSTESGHFEKRETVPMGADEFSSRLKLLWDMEDRLCTEVTITTGENTDLDRCKLRLKFVEQLLLEKERFSKVFKTSNGSVYFHLETGETIRAKMVDDKYEFSVGDGKHFMLQSMMNNLFFLPKSESERLVGVRDLYPGEKIQTIPYGLGVVPFEINKKGYPSQIAFKEENGELLLIGTKFRSEEEIDTEVNLVGGYHFGHPITEIVK